MADATQDAAMLDPTRRGRALALWRSFAENRGAVIGLFFIVFVVLLAIFADLIAPHDPTFQYRDFFRHPPVWHEEGLWRFPLGTDDLGRDLLSRIIHGARWSMFVGAVVVTLSMVAGIAIGLVAGYVGGWVETIVMRLMDVILAFPSLLLALVMVAILGPGLLNAMIAIAIVLLPHFVRLTRSSVIAEKGKEYVIASRVAGAGHGRLMLSAILPNCLAPLIVQATLSFSTAILDAAALGFLGMGAQPPTPEWGAMLANARQFMQAAPWIVTFPGLAILLTVLAINLVGDGLRDALDPKMKRT